MTPLDQAKARIRELENQLAEAKETIEWQARENVEALDRDLQAAIRYYGKLTPQEAWVVVQLYQAKRFITPSTLLAELPAVDHVVERDVNIVKVLVHKIRKKWGIDALETTGGGGFGGEGAYRLTKVGADIVQRAIQGEIVDPLTESEKRTAHRRKFTSRQIVEIRRSRESASVLAAHHKVELTAILQILKRKTYKDVP